MLEIPPGFNPMQADKLADWLKADPTRWQKYNFYLITRDPGMLHFYRFVSIERTETGNYSVWLGDRSEMVEANRTLYYIESV